MRFIKRNAKSLDSKAYRHNVARMQRAPRVPKTRGAHELKAWMDAHNVSQQALAERLGVHQTTVSLWMALEPGRMSIGHALALQRETEVPPSAWDSPPPANDSPRDTGTHPRVAAAKPRRRAKGAA